ncbi:Rne/Rng family ribonuclease [Arthrobacter castelli]|uniref:Rne/Rng family ribonuclease n=1 Tax=Arthrobacter castelli TaxID=271431 RepID=UPI000401669A|nr:Rne/Rng family ribonuclease [Arthrobacter castelli]
MDNDQVPSSDSEQPAEQLNDQAAPAAPAEKPARRSRTRKSAPAAQSDAAAGEAPAAESGSPTAGNDAAASEAPPANNDTAGGDAPADEPETTVTADSTGSAGATTRKAARAPAKKRTAPSRAGGRNAKSGSDDGGTAGSATDRADDTNDTAGTESAATTGGADATTAGAAAGTGDQPGHQDEREAAAQSAPATPPVSVLFQAPDLSEIRSGKDKSPSSESATSPSAGPDSPSGATAEETAGSGGDADGDGGSNQPRRNRRNRNRNRNRDSGNGDNSGTGGNGADDGTPASEQDDSGDTGNGSKGDQGNGGNGSVSGRRRRRRRRGDSDLELTGGDDDGDPPNTVTRVRAPRQHSEAPASEGVTSVKGSTRLEAKKQRRRESRESGRRRQVITEAEFLARRESVDRTMVVRQSDERIQIGVLEDGVLAEHFVSRTQQDSLIGNVYVGKVQNVLPSMEAAFVDIGRGRNAVLYAGEVNWDAAGMGNQPRRIENALKSGDSVVVQVTKDPVGHKGARLTSQVSLPGRYLVYVPGGSMTGISRKLPDVERNRLKKILKDRLPDNAGVIVRTAAEGASEQELTNDINRLRALWESIESNSTSNKTVPPEMLYAEPDLTIKVVRDVFNEDFSKLVISGDEAWDTIEAYVTYVAPDLVGRLEKWTKDEDIFAAWRIDEQITKALERKVFLPSGGSLVIDRTEAMTVVDVNTGKFTGSGGNLEETVTKNNLEAAEEVVRQLRLRDIGGIIVIDFIDMVLESNRDLVLRRMVECLGRDRTKHQVAEVTSLGLVQMTRKRMGTGLLEVFGEACEHCAGRGVVTHGEPVEQHKVDHGHHQQHLRSEKQSRSEKKRSRKQRQQENQPARQANSEESDSDRQAKADAAREALANIAAASHTSGEHPKEDAEMPEAQQPTGKESGKQGGKQSGKQSGKGTSGEEAAAASEQSREPAQAGRSKVAADEGTVLTIQGEPVVVPKSDASEAAEADQEPRLTLDSLTEAFEGQSGKGAPESARQPGPESPSVAGAGKRRPRRHRSARSAQGAANSNPVEAYDDESQPGSTQAAHRHTAMTGASGSGEKSAESAGAAAADGAPEADGAPDAGKQAPAPMVLGTGVPASEL